MKRTANRAGRVLVFCPPHLLESWRNEVKAVFPDAEYRVLQTVSDVDAFAEIDPETFAVAVLSREAAKLGHRLEGVEDRCPKCAIRLSAKSEELARKRARCIGQVAIPQNPEAEIARAIALQLRVHGVKDYLPRGAGPSAIADRWDALGKKRPTYEKPLWRGLPHDLIARIRTAAIQNGHYGRESPARKALVWALAAEGVPPEAVLAAARALKPDHYDYEHFVESLLLLLPSGGALGMAFEILESLPKPSYGYVSTWETATAWFQKKYDALSKVKSTRVVRDEPSEDAEDEDPDALGDGDEDEDDAAVVRGTSEGVSISGIRLGRSDSGLLTFNGCEAGSVEAAKELLRVVGSMGSWERGTECGEHLYQSVPDPRRYPLAKYIIRRHRGTFDFVIIDEAHEAGNQDSAQSAAAFRLTNLRLPSILMTGTIMNGYAESLFAPFVNTDKDFQDEFARNESGAFVDRYGYRKRYVSDKEDGKVVAYGTQSDRVERTEKDVGQAPGVLPLFLFQFLLKGAVTLHKADLRIDLPKLSQERVVASCEGTELGAEFKRMLDKLVTQIKSDRYDEEKSGKLFGQLAEIPSYLDRATVDVGNGHGKEYEVRYPESVGGGLVVSGRLFPKSEILPKEALMLDVLEREIKEGRRVMVFGWHTDREKGDILARLARLIRDRIDDEAPILYADKVGTAKRQSWIDKNVVAKKARVLVTNPVCIQTGLNNLVWFASIWQHENPACNPIVDRQSIGRIDRIGQKLETRVFRAFYGGTIQEKMHDLLMSKVAISTATDGLDPESAMLAAGVERDSFVTGLSLGKALWKMMEEEGFESEVRPKLKLAVSGGRRR